MPRLLLALLLALALAHAEDTDELKVKREEVFEFASKPAVTRNGDRIEIAFETKGRCDVTVAVEDLQGRIVRHLASGVLGANAPEPFRKDSLAQLLVWDGKDDLGRYVDDKEACAVRVSLGLKPRLERTLYWSPKKRYGRMPVICASPEGVLVADGKGVDFINLFDHEGNFVRPVYPFPRAKLEQIEGLRWHDFPQGYRLPLKGGLYQTTLLTSGSNYHTGNHAEARSGVAASAMAIQGERLATAFMHLNRLTTGGDTVGLKLDGPKVGFEVQSVAGDGMSVFVGPSSMAFSPDAKTLYLTGYLWRSGSWNKVPGCEHAVLKLDFEADAEPVVWKGDRKQHGDDDKHFRVPTSVACDPQGRVYVTDLLNDRVQVFTPDGKLLKSLKAEKPAKVCVHRKSGEVWVFSYEVVGVPYDLFKKYAYTPQIAHKLTRFSALPEGKKLSEEDFPLGAGDAMGFEVSGHVFQVELDSWAKEPTVWVVGRKHEARGAEFNFNGQYAKHDNDPQLWKAGVRIQRKVKDKWEVVHSFGDETAKEVVRAAPPRHNIQRLIVHPLTGKLYVAEPDSGPTIKASNSWLEIDPETGTIKELDLPFNAMEACFDLEGYVYLRNTDMIARYEFPSFREVPFDYGEEREKLGNDGSIYGKSTKVVGGLKMPATSPVCYHQGGIYVTPKGDIVASCAYRYVGISSGHLARDKEKTKEEYAYRPALYPGRTVNSTSPCLHVWNKRGQLKYEDAIPGVGQCDGVGMDEHDRLYVMHAPTRAYGGKPYFDHMSETLMKFEPNKVKVVSSTPDAPLALSAGAEPQRAPDLIGGRHGKAWADHAHWHYGGVGFAGFNMKGHGGGCACWFARFTLDLFARSIAPEPYQYRVAVLDTSGNLILRIGHYGNVQDGKPLVATGGPKETRSVGGDEVSLMHACFVGTQTDRRIFIADYGNARILSVKLDYHAGEKVPLKDVKDLAAAGE